ncbi:MAG: ATP-binding cassette domain-containing protein [Deltaproteobacteria bacterium]|nr:ATP-binding cassette domain-containing protein [Deltaproteobacteria bacterium]
MLEIKNIHKTFFPGTVNEVKALQGVDFTLEDGVFTAIIGTNGSGKSTVLNAVAGTFEPDAGTILLDGRDITHWPEFRRAAFIGRVFQNPFAGTAAEMSIAENIVMAMRRGKRRGLGPALGRRTLDEIADRVRELKMGLEDRLHNPIGTLSGGQRQALTLLMATWLRPKVLLLDEHTAALDPKSAAKVAELTSEIIAREKLAALMVTHSMQQAVTMPDRILMMHRGRVVEDYRDEMKRRVRIPDLIEAFNRVTKRELFTEPAAAMLERQYL